MNGIAAPPLPPTLSPAEHALLDELAGDLDLGWLELRPGMDVLEVGCGTGVVSRRVARVVAPGRVVALDIDPAALDAGRRLTRDEGVSNVEFRQADLADLSGLAGLFDVVFSRAVLMYAADPIEALLHQRRAARPGGLVASLGEGDWGTAVIEPANGIVAEAVARLQAGIRSAGGDPLIGRRLPGLFHAAGLTDVAVSDGGGSGQIVAGAALAGPRWARAMAGLMERVDGRGTPAEELETRIRAWASQPGAILLWPRVVRARGRR